MFDLGPSRFLELVKDGHMPEATTVDGIKRWDVEQLQEAWRRHRRTHKIGDDKGGKIWESTDASQDDWGDSDN